MDKPSEGLFKFRSKIYATAIIVGVKSLFLTNFALTPPQVSGTPYPLQPLPRPLPPLACRAVIQCHRTSYLPTPQFAIFIQNLHRHLYQGRPYHVFLGLKKQWFVKGKNLTTSRLFKMQHSSFFILGHTG